MLTVFPLRLKKDLKYLKALIKEFIKIMCIFNINTL
jgi:hypothetical protein